MTTTPNWFDIGVNLMDKRFNADRDQVVQRARDAQVMGMLITGTDLDSSTRAANYCESDNTSRHIGPEPLIYSTSTSTSTSSALASTAGVHPHNADAVDPTTQRSLVELLASPSVRAVGECGLDFNRNFSTPTNQRAAFQLQIELAQDLDLPLFVHDRDSHGEVASFLDRTNLSAERVVIHCFTGDRHTLDSYLERGYYIGITGWVADPNRGQPLSELIPSIPLNRLLLETDAPYLWPRNAPRRPKAGRNEPSYLPWVAQRVAELCDIHLDQLAAVTTSNARQLFFNDAQ